MLNQKTQLGPGLQPGDGETEDGIIYMKGRNYHATGGAEEADDVEVFAGSIFATTETGSLSRAARHTRSELIAERLLIASELGLVLQENIFFDSFTAAAEAVSGTKINGWRSWHFIYKDRPLVWEEDDEDEQCEEDDEDES